ncbi:IS701 family transposase [Saccharothrix sp. ALI-22-I]|uniref:IS701 family transposase n=1 Tax=Saccharothrix sp. ALI-22-I TaxID=1933778 RepID=UPI00193107D2|nr:transposase [Saccharothrix sp. ALI-22-I]
MQRLQFFLSESAWDVEAVDARRLELLLADPATAPHGNGVLVVDDSGDRKDGNATAHVGSQYLGRYGKIDRGIVTVTTLWADENLYYPLHSVPYTPASCFPEDKNDPDFRTKLQIGAGLARDAHAAGVAFRAVVADAAYGDQDAFRGDLSRAGLPFVMALRPKRGTWARQDEAHTPVDAALALAGTGPEDPGDWVEVTRVFRDGHTRTWWAADARLGQWGPDGAIRLVVATTDPGMLPDKSTWYLTTNLSRPGGPREHDGPHPPADLAEIVRLYGIRHWIEQSYKQVKDELGWADFQGPFRHRDPPAPMPGQRRVLLLLERLVRRSGTDGTRPCEAAAGPGHTTGPAREGDPRRSPQRTERSRARPGHELYGESVAGWPPGDCFSATGERGQPGPRPWSCRHCSTPSLMDIH